MIDYGLIDQAVRFYKDRGYVQFDVPWTIGKEAYYATKPPEVMDLHVVGWDAYLTASGEQSFIEMMLNGRQLKKAVCVTPCFRDDRTDDIHRKYFTKVELIKADEVSMAHLINMVHDAMAFFEQFVTVKVLEIGPQSFDLICKKSRIELGSYGIREYKNLKWIYGTGCAEPRLSDAINLIREQSGQLKRSAE